MSKLEDYDHGQKGEVVFYVHGSESLRTYLGLSKFHSRPDCRALARRLPCTVVRDRIDSILPSQRCKLCNPLSSQPGDVLAGL